MRGLVPLGGTIARSSLSPPSLSVDNIRARVFDRVRASRSMIPLVRAVKRAYMRVAIASREKEKVVTRVVHTQFSRILCVAFFCVKIVVTLITEDELHDHIVAQGARKSCDSSVYGSRKLQLISKEAAKRECFF